MFKCLSFNQYYYRKCKGILIVISYGIFRGIEKAIRIESIKKWLSFWVHNQKKKNLLFNDLLLFVICSVPSNCVRYHRSSCQFKEGGYDWMCSQCYSYLKPYEFLHTYFWRWNISFVRSIDVVFLAIRSRME